MGYALNKARLTRLYCVNKSRPRLHCSGRCYLAQKLRKAADTEKKAPAGPEKVKYEVLPAAAAFVPRRLRQCLPPAPRFAALRGSCYTFAPVRGVFHPPAVRG